MSQSINNKHLIYNQTKKNVNYLYNNPIKHGLVTNLLDYPYSSFHSFLKQHGRNYLIKQFREYPEYKDLQLDED